MKRRPTRKRGDKVVVKFPTPAQPIKGRYGKNWYSPEFLLWCRRQRLKPERIAACVLHTMALECGDRPVVIHSKKPLTGDYFESEGKEGN